MTKTIWVFPGQGSQSLGMVADLESSDVGVEKLKIADDILGWSIVEKTQEEVSLSQTLYTQPSLYVVEAILLDLLRDRGEKPDLVAGHSLGEFVALYAAGTLDFTTGLKLVKKRAELMQAASGGKMNALIGFDRTALEDAINATEGVVIANDNSDAQVVISGTPEAVEKIVTSVKSKLAIYLNVSGAFHSPYMAEAAAEFAELLAPLSFANPQFPVMSNVEPTPSSDSNVLKDRLARQMTGSVRWREICNLLPELSVEKAIEVGPGKVLTGLIKRTCPQVQLGKIASLKDIQSLS
jgi:[acyl-carrier-protein] S-malonyltransferase